MIQPTPPTPRNSKKRLLRRLVLWPAGFLLMLIVVLGILIACLPYICSLNSVKHIIEQQATTALHQPFTVEDISWRWTEALTITGITLAGDPTPLLDLRRIEFKFFFKRLLKRKIHGELYLKGLTAQIVRDKDGQINLLKPLAAQDRPSKAPEPEKTAPPSAKSSPPVLPVDVTLHVHLDDFNIQYEDQLLARTVVIRKTSLHFDLPSLLNTPAELTLSLLSALDGHPIPKVAVHCKVASIFTPDGRPDLNRLQATVTGHLPGIQIDVNGGLKHTALKGRIDLDLNQIFNVARPFLPPAIAPQNVTGKLGLLIDSKGDPQKSVDFMVALEAEDLLLDGGPLKDKAIGPLNLSLRQDGAYDAINKHITLKQGRFTLLHQSEIKWHGDLKAFDTKTPMADLHLERLYLDLGELFRKVAHLVPVPLPMTFAVKDGETVLDLNGADFSGALSPEGNAAVQVQSLDIKIGAIDFHKAPLNLNTGPLHLSVKNLATRLEHFFPTDATVTLALLLEELAFNDAQQSLHVPRLQFPPFHLRCAPIAPKGRTNVQLDDFAVLLPRTHLKKIPNGESSLTMTSQGLRLALPKLTVALEDLFPTGIDLAMAISLGAFELKNPNQTVTLEGLAIPQCKLSLANLQKPSSPHTGWSADLKLDERLTLDAFGLTGQARVKDFSQSLAIACALHPDARVEMNLRQAHIETPVIDITHKALAPFQTPLSLNVAARSVAFQPKPTPTADVQGGSITLQIGDLLNLNLDCSLGDTAQKFLRTQGAMVIDLAHLPFHLIPPPVESIRLAGKTRLDWSFDGRRPTQKELDRFKGIQSLDFGQDLKFLNACQIALGLDHIDCDLTLTPDKHFKLGPVSTLAPLSYRLDMDHQEGVLETDLQIQNITALGAIVPPKPLSTRFKLKAGHQGLKNLTLSQELTISPFQFGQSLKASFFGLNRILGETLKPSAVTLLRMLEGSVDLDLTIKELRQIGMLAPDMDLDGAITLSGQVVLEPGHQIRARTHLQMPEMNVAIKNRVQLDHLYTDLDLEKRYAIKGKASAQTDTPLPLSVKVMRPAAPLAEAPGSLQFQNSSTQSFIEGTTTQNLLNRMQTRPTIAFETVGLQMTPFPLDIRHGALNFDLIDGLPAFEYFRFDILGGTLIGSLALTPKEDSGYFLMLRLRFSGIDTGKIFPDTTSSLSGAIAEVSGHLRLLVPITPHMQTLLAETHLEIEFSHIGARSLERLLYALDPYENNEAITTQRNLLRQGYPRWIKITFNDGALSLLGEIEIKGFRIAIPPLERFNITDLPGLDKIEQKLAPMSLLIKFLNMAHSETLFTDPKDGISFTP